MFTHNTTENHSIGIPGTTMLTRPERVFAAHISDENLDRIVKHFENTEFQVYATERSRSGPLVGTRTLVFAGTYIPVDSGFHLIFTFQPDGTLRYKELLSSVSMQAMYVKEGPVKRHEQRNSR